MEDNYIDTNVINPHTGGLYKVKLSNGVITHVPYTRTGSGRCIWLLPSEFNIRVTHWVKGRII